MVVTVGGGIANKKHSIVGFNGRDRRICGVSHTILEYSETSVEVKSLILAQRVGATSTMGGITAS